MNLIQLALVSYMMVYTDYAHQHSLPLLILMLLKVKVSKQIHVLWHLLKV